jgi:carboxyl-terminal processing protease
MMILRVRRYLIRGLLSFPLFAGAMMADPAEPDQDWGKVRDDTFELVWSTVNDSYFDPQFGGVDWPGVRKTYRTKIDEAADKQALRFVLQAMLGELGKTHFAIVPREAAVFTPEERKQVGTVGANMVTAGGEVVVANVEADSAAAAAGLRNGDKIIQVKGRDVAEVSRLYAETGVTTARRDFYLNQFVSSPLSGAVGESISVEVEGADGKVRTVEMKSEMRTGLWSEPLGNMPSVPLFIETRRDEDGLGYLKFNVFAPALMKPIRGFFRELRAGDGLVIDLRGNPGGIILMASGMCGWLSTKEFSLGRMRMRDGVSMFDVFPQAKVFSGPVAVLIDNGSASTSEVLAAGLQEAGRARIFGEISAGAALPSAFLKLPTGDLLQYAIADLSTPRGATLEGVGVTPDEIVNRSRDDISAQRDPVLDAARTWLNQQRKPTAGDQ